MMSPESLQARDVLEITFDGAVLETYPARFNKIYSVRKVSQKED